MAGNTVSVSEEASAGAETEQVFELRTYTAAEGKFDDLLARFRDHTLRIFEKHGMTNLGYWTPQDEPLSANTLIYVLAHPSREEAEQSWRDFSSDPEWQSVAEESQRDGRLIAGLERVFLGPTDFSPMR
ncbi:MAG: NIPSNAP family protein [Arenicellales bacterium]|nr:NIPSNAP family protein [Arenicellales bacterium]